VCGRRLDVEGVLVKPCPSATGLLEEEHRLERPARRADERLDDVQDARVQQEALVDRQLAMEHVDRGRERGHVRDVSQQLIDLLGATSSRTTRKPCSW
jgi:hypothetical protein